MEESTNQQWLEENQQKNSSLILEEHQQVGTWKVSCVKSFYSILVLLLYLFILLKIVPTFSSRLFNIDFSASNNNFDPWQKKDLYIVWRGNCMMTSQPSRSISLKELPSFVWSWQLACWDNLGTTLLLHFLVLANNISGGYGLFKTGKRLFTTQHLHYSTTSHNTRYLYDF